ncbi:MAG: ATPase [Xanthobacteraceae bacterium]|nr:MAG: ATPase [Xanthobacteraceae bacterium]
MRELFEEGTGSSLLDPHEAARASLRVPLRRRFYKAVTVERRASGFAVLLDGKPMRTPARRLLVAPQQGIAEALAAEWGAQREHIDPSCMPLTRLANSIIDGVADTAAAVAGDIGRYFNSDLLFYRASHPHELVERQAARWDPVLAWMAERFGVRFVLVEGVMHVAQPEAALAAARNALPADPWALGALHSATTLMGSALLALALAHGRLGAQEAWTAAHVDEDWNFDLWGKDDTVLARRAVKFAELEAAAAVLRLAGGG